MVDLSQLEKVKTESEMLADEAKNKAIEYLRSTDWYIIRNLETSAEIPDEVRQGRKQARITLDKQ